MVPWPPGESYGTMATWCELWHYGHLVSVMVLFPPGEIYGTMVTWCEIWYYGNLVRVMVVFDRKRDKCNTNGPSP